MGVFTWLRYIQYVVYTFMEDYPPNLMEFEGRFSTEEACRDYLYQLRWPNGFCCSGCGHDSAWPVGTVLFECARCNYQTSIVSGTIFHGTHKPLTLWFRTIWWLTGQLIAHKMGKLRQIPWRTCPELSCLPSGRGQAMVDDLGLSAMYLRVSVCKCCLFLWLRSRRERQPRSWILDHTFRLCLIQWSRSFGCVKADRR